MRKKVKNAIIYTITGAACAIWGISASALDSASPIPFCALVASSIWLVLFMWANGFFKED